MSDLTRYRIVREVEVESYPTGRLTTVPIYEPDDSLQDIADAWREFQIAENEWWYRNRSKTLHALAGKLDGLVKDE